MYPVPLLFIIVTALACTFFSLPFLLLLVTRISCNVTALAIIHSFIQGRCFRDLRTEFLLLDLQHQLPCARNCSVHIER